MHDQESIYYISLSLLTDKYSWVTQDLYGMTFL